MFDYTSLIDELVTGKSPEYEMAQHKLDDLRDKGAISLGQNDSLLHSAELCGVLQCLRCEAVKHLRGAFEELEFIDTLMLLGKARPTIVTASLDDVITPLAQSGIEMKPSDWVVICMLCDEAGKRLTPQQLVNALRENRLANKKPIARRESFVQAYVAYPRNMHFPAWPQNSTKEKRYYKIATLIKPLIDVMS